MTTKEYIREVDFDYIKTFSLLREEETKDYVDNLQTKAKTTLDKNEKRKLIDLTIRGTKEILIETGTPHPTAVRTNTFNKSDPETVELLSILSLDYKNHNDSMCAPIFREMIVFYDKSDKVVSILNICLSCDRVEDEHFNTIKTDSKVFERLREYFKSIGHAIEEN
ncbi:MAG: hypothetical protein JNL17_00025 [Cyclobacteriaceae bacterium]|nr:hypothetical protein [Cyclobacteriaceae bacterium]